MKLKKIYIILIIFICVVGFWNGEAKTYADQDAMMTELKNNMENVGKPSVPDNSRIGSVVNIVINLIQYTGSGIAVIIVTMTGIKYMIASANEKADLKKQAVPIVTGCVLLFAAVNIVGILADAAVGLNT